MNKLIPLLTVVALAAGCGEKPIATIDMTCGTVDITARVYQNHLNAFMDGKNIKMDQTVSADGARYESRGAVMTDIVLWNKGDDWLFFIDPNDMPVSCVLRTIEAQELKKIGE